MVIYPHCSTNSGTHPKHVHPLGCTSHASLFEAMNHLKLPHVQWYLHIPSINFAQLLRIFFPRTFPACPGVKEWSTKRQHFLQLVASTLKAMLVNGDHHPMSWMKNKLYIYITILIYFPPTSCGFRRPFQLYLPMFGKLPRAQDI